MNIFNIMGYTSDYDPFEILGGGTSRGVVSSTALETAEGVAIWTGLALVLAIIGGILVHFLFVKAKTEPKGKFLKWLKEFLTFRVMWIETIVKICYYISSIFVVLFSFNFLSAGGIGVLAFLITLVGGPILVRLVYEASMMFIMIWRNTKDIADNTKKKKE